MRDLGRLGESTFSVWCSQVGLVANPSIIDKTGWDFYVQFPITDDLSVSKLHKPAFECRVQVKATDNRDRKWQITLSNLRQMATASMPTFYCFLEFDNKNEVQRAFLLHVDSNRIYSILKKIHEIEQSDKDNNLNKRKMTIHYGMEDQIKVLDGENLKNLLLSFIGDDYPKYLQDKNNFLKNCGFSDGHGILKFSVIGENGIQQMVDVSLGITEEIEVKNVVSREQRFGIPVKNPHFELSEAKLKISKIQSKKGKIRFKDSRFSIGWSFPIDFYLAPFSFGDYREFSKFRVIGSFFDIVCEPYKNQGVYHFHFDDQKFEVKEFQAAIQSIILMTSEGESIIVEIELDNYPVLDFQLKTQKIDHDLDYAFELFKKVENICIDMNLGNEVLFSLQDLYENDRRIKQLHDFLKYTDDVLCSARFTLEEVQMKHETTASIFAFDCRLGLHFIVLIISLLGKVHKTDKDDYEMKDCKIMIEKKYAYSMINPMTNEDINNEMNKIASKYEDYQNTIILRTLID